MKRIVSHSLLIFLLVALLNVATIKCTPIVFRQAAPTPSIVPIPDVVEEDQVAVPVGATPTPTRPVPPVTTPPSGTQPPQPAPSTVPASTPAATQPPQTPPSPGRPLPPSTPEETEEPVPSEEAGGAAGSSDLDGDGVNVGAIVGGVLGGLALLLLLLILLICCLRRRKDDEESPTGLYHSDEAANGDGTRAAAVGAGAVAHDGDDDIPKPPEGGVPEPPQDTYTKDDARDLAPAVPPTGPSEEETAAAAAAAAAAATAAATAMAEKEKASAAAMPRGPTPPPHDYVLGAGPAATKSEFVDLRTKFERDEIGDNSAVLGREREGVIGEGLEMDMMQPAEEIGTGTTALPHETAAASGAAATAAGAALYSSKDSPVEGIEEYVPARSVQDPRIVEGDDGTLPDREGHTVPVTFESQERLMAGGDGSGAISDAPTTLTAASIAEESGDVPSLERDPIASNQGREPRF